MGTVDEEEGTHLFGGGPLVRLIVEDTREIGRQALHPLDAGRPGGDSSDRGILVSDCRPQGRD